MLKVSTVPHIPLAFLFIRCGKGIPTPLIFSTTLLHMITSTNYVQMKAK